MKRQPIKDAGEIAELHALLIEGLKLPPKQTMREKMFFKLKKPTSDSITYANVKAELDALLAKAEVAHINQHILVDLLESRAHAIRCKAAANYSVAPRMHSGNI